MGEPAIAGQHCALKKRNVARFSPPRSYGTNPSVDTTGSITMKHTTGSMTTENTTGSMTTGNTTGSLRPVDLFKKL